MTNKTPLTVEEGDAGGRRQAFYDQCGTGASAPSPLEPQEDGLVSAGLLNSERRVTDDLRARNDALRSEVERLREALDEIRLKDTIDGETGELGDIAVNALFPRRQSEDGK